MQVHDIGELTGDVILFGGGYSNLQATLAMLQRAGDLGISIGNRICTGDVVAYCARPNETLDALRGNVAACVAGNVERQLADDADDCGCGFETGSACDLLSDGWYPYAKRRVTAAHKQWMAQLPDVVLFQNRGKRCAVIHGGVTDISRFLWPSTPDAQFQAEITALQVVVGKVDYVFAGHSGIAFVRNVAGVAWVNAGVIGMPPHDGRRDTRFALLMDNGVRFERLAYDADGAAQDMCTAGLMQGYDTALLSGVWPSEDVLPIEMRRA